MFLQKFYIHRKMNEMSELGAGGGTSQDLDSFDGDAKENFDDLEFESDSSKALNDKLNGKFKDRIEKAKAAKKEVDEDESEEKPEKKPTKKQDNLDLNHIEEEDSEEKKPDEKKSSTRKDDKKKEDSADKKALEADEVVDDKKFKEDQKLGKVKIRQSDGLYGIEPDAKVRVKIDGDFQEVGIQDLINNYSGKIAYDKKFTEIGNEKKSVETLRAEVSKSREFLINTVKEVTSHLTDSTKNPLDSLYKLVERSGGDTYTTYKRMLEANLEEVEKLMSMSDVERENYWLKKKDEFRSKSDEARKAESIKEASFNQGLQKIDSLRQAHGVSEDQFLQALDELESEGKDTNKLTDEYVVDHASLKPHVSSVQDVLEPYQDSIDDSKYSEIVRNFARQLRAKEYTLEQLKEWAKEKFADEDIKDLQSRTKEVQKPSQRGETRQPQRLDTLDFDDEE